MQSLFFWPWKSSFVCCSISVPCGDAIVENSWKHTAWSCKIELATIKSYHQHGLVFFIFFQVAFQPIPRGGSSGDSETHGHSRICHAICFKSHSPIHDRSASRLLFLPGSGCTRWPRLNAINITVQYRCPSSRIVHHKSRSYPSCYSILSPTGRCTERRSATRIGSWYPGYRIRHSWSEPGEWTAIYLCSSTRTIGISSRSNFWKLASIYQTKKLVDSFDRWEEGTSW